MRPRELEHYIEIPLSEYERLVRELAETRIYLQQRSEENFSKTLDLKDANDKLSEPANLYDQVVVELESYKRAYDYNKEDQ